MDRAFLLDVYVDSRRAELIGMGWPPEQLSEFVAMQFGFQQRGYQMSYPAAEHRILLVEGEPAGQWRVQRGDEEIVLVDIALLDRFRGRGIGSECIRALCREAADRAAVVRLSVRPDNRAYRLYRRLGFAEQSRDEACICLAWRAARVDGAEAATRPSSISIPSI